jgi:hypothetical protein
MALINLPQYSSWCRVIYNFITDPTIGPFSRVRRRIQDEYNEKKQNGENMTMNITLHHDEYCGKVSKSIELEDIF